MKTVQDSLGRLWPDRYKPEDLEIRLQEMDAFARNLAHELQTPLTQVEGIANLLMLQKGQDELAGPWLEKLASIARSMRHTVSDVLELARCDGTSTVPLASIDLSALCQRMVVDLSSEEPSHDVQWTVQPSMRISGRASQIALLIRNLLSNAVKFTRGKPGPQVSVTCAPLGSYRTLLVVEDNGVGFDPADVNRLFQPFQRLHHDVRFEGTGLGLMIARRVAEIHGGGIRADAVLGGGARFEVDLPDVPANSVQGE